MPRDKTRTRFNSVVVDRMNAVMPAVFNHASLVDHDRPVPFPMNCVVSNIKTLDALVLWEDVRQLA